MKNEIILFENQDVKLEENNTCAKIAHVYFKGRQTYKTKY